eukprot:677222-Alexandrium_andersonii.AAC.1
MEAVNSQRNIDRGAQGLAPVPPRGYGMFTFPEVILKVFLHSWRPNEEMEEVEQLVDADGEVEYAPQPAR